MALANIVINAIKYSDPDKTVCLTAEKKDEYVIILVEDESFGIECKHLGRQFERFYPSTPPAAASSVEPGRGF